MAVMFGTGRRWLPLLCGACCGHCRAGSFFSPAMKALKPMVAAVERRQLFGASLAPLFVPGSRGLTRPMTRPSTPWGDRGGRRLRPLVAAFSLARRPRRSCRARGPAGSGQ
jgi:hypothetical protein